MPDCFADKLNNALSDFFISNEIIGTASHIEGFCIWVMSKDVIPRAVEALKKLQGFAIHSKEQYTYQGYQVFFDIEGIITACS